MKPVGKRDAHRKAKGVVEVGDTEKWNNVFMGGERGGKVGA